MQEFIEKARDLSTGARGNKHALKEAEIFLQAARKSRTDATFVICIQILNSSQAHSIEPENIVAAQSLCWICKHKQLSGDQFNALLAVFQLLTTTCKPTHPVAIQVVAALSAAIVIGFAPGENWLNNSLQPILALGQSNSVAQRYWVSYIVLVASHLPEIAASKDVISIISDRNCTGRADALLNPHAQQIVSVVHVQQSVLQESCVVEGLLRMALSASTPADTELLAACSRCCTLWVEYAASLLQALPADCEAAEVLEALGSQCAAAVRSLAMWIDSPVLTATTCLLANHENSNKDALDACVELLVAVCSAASMDITAQATAANKGNKKHSPGPAQNTGKAKGGTRSSTQQQQCSTAELAGRVDYELHQLAQKVTQQLLPVLSAALDTGAHTLLALHRALLEGNQQCNAEDVLVDCLCVFRGNCDCITALMDRFLARVFSTNSQDLADLGTLGTLGQMWTQYLTAFTHSTRAHIEALTALAELEVLSETWELVDPLRELLEVLLPVVTAMTEHVAAAASADACSAELQAVRAQLTALVHGLVEGAVVAAVTAAAYLEVSFAAGAPADAMLSSPVSSAFPTTALFIPEQSLQQQEDLDEFRNNVRDSLRSLVAVMPNLCGWLLRHTHGAVLAFVASVKAGCAQAGSSAGVAEAAQLGAGWAVAEALLHAVSAVTKQILSSLRGTSSAKTDLYAALHTLLRLLTSEEIVSACRPLSRICAVLYGEFASTLLERGATDLCSAMVHRLLVSLQHPEAPFAVQCVGTCGEGASVRAVVHVVPSSLPVCLGGLLQPTLLRLFTNTNSSEDSSRGTSTRMVDLLCLQGCGLPFRVKQDHIGAVSLLKVMSTLYSSAVSNHASAAATPGINMLLELPRVVQDLKETHSQAQRQLSYAVLLFQQHILSDTGVGVPNHALVLLRYCYFYLSFLQSVPSRDRPLSPKSFHLVFHSTLTCLICHDSGTAMTAIGAVLIPTYVAAMQSISAQDSAILAQGMYAIYGTTANTEVTQAVCELSASLGAHCSLAQLIYTVGAIISAVTAKCKKSRRIQDMESLVCVIESCATVLQSLAASAQSRSYTEIELRALCTLFASCRIEFLPSTFEYQSVPDISSFAPQAVSALRGVYSSYATLLQHLAGDQTGAGRAELVLPAACSFVRCLCSWYSVVDVSEAFQIIVRELSEQGVRIMHIEQQRMYHTAASTAAGSIRSTHSNISSSDEVNVEDINMLTEREDSGSHRNSGELRSLGALLQLWSSSLAATELLPHAAVLVGKSTAKGSSSDQDGSSCCKLSLAALSEASLQCIISAVCDLFAPLGVSASAGAPLSVELWGSALAVLALALGPVLHRQGTQQSGAYVALSADGCIALGALADKAVACTHSPGGVQSVVDCYVSCGLAERIACALLYALLQSNSDTTGGSVSSVNPHQPMSFPSELRDQCISVLLKYILSFGATHSAAQLSAALAHPACPCNGAIGTQEGRATWVGRLIMHAAAGDWKKFKSTTKTLCRG